MSTRINSTLRWIVGGAALAAILTVIAIIAWPASAADQAYDDGHRLGNAVSDLYDAETTYEVDDALDEVHAAARDARIHAGDEVAEQADEQTDALAQAANGFLGATSSTDEWDQELYQEELDSALADLESQASEFRTDSSEVPSAFWEGYQDGLNG